MQTAKRAWTVASVDWKGLPKDFQELVQAQQRIRSWSGMTLAQFRKDRGFLENDLVVEGEAWWPGNLRRWAKAYHEKERAQIDAAQDTEIKPYADELLDFLNSNAPPETPVPTKPVAALSVGQERHLKRLVALTQKVTPAQLRYHGFLIQNPDRVPEEGLHALFEGINYLLALFKQKDMLPLLQKTLTGFEIEAKKEVEESRLQATYYPSTKHISVPSITLSTRAGVWSKSKLAENFIHEVGHHIHENLLAPQAKAEWDKGWGGFESKKDMPPEKLQALGIPSEYGQTDFKEDFAETFLYFMLAPEKLSATAKFRMQRTLWLSGWYDKPIMRVAQHNRIWYHGTPKKFDAFQVQRKQTFGTGASDTPLFFTPEESFARLYASGPHGTIYKVRLQWKKVFDSDNLIRSHRYWPPEREALTPEGQVLYDDLAAGHIFSIPPDDWSVFHDSQGLFASILKHQYDVLESTEFKRWMKARGYDASYVRGDGPTNVFVLHPSQVEIIDQYPMSSKIGVRVASRWLNSQRLGAGKKMFGGPSGT